MTDPIYPILLPNGSDNWLFGDGKDIVWRYSGDIAWSFVVDWDNDGVFDGSGDEASRVVAVSTSRGREYRFRSDGRGYNYPRIGRATVTLDNHDGRYDPYNAGGALYGNLLPGRRFKLVFHDNVNATSYNVIHGFIEDIDPISGTDYVHISCVDDLKLFQEFDLEADLLEGADVAAIIAAILTDMAWAPASSIDDIDSDIVGFWWASDISALKMLEQLSDSVLGIFFIANDGEFRFYSRHHSYSSVTTLTSDEVLKKIPLPQPWETVRNYIKVKAYPREKADTSGSAETLWELFDVPYIEPEATLTFWAENYSSGELIPAEMIALTTADYTANSASGGDSTDMTDDLVVVDTPISITKKIAVTNSDTATVAYLTKLESKGFPITTTPTVVIKESTSSQNTYGENRFILDNEWIQNSNLADDFANFLRVDLSTPDASPTVYIENRPDIQFALDLFDIATLDITALTISGEYHAAYIEHRWTAGGGVLTKIKFEPSVNYQDNYWVFPTKVGETSIFGY